MTMIYDVHLLDYLVFVFFFSYFFGFFINLLILGENWVDWDSVLYGKLF